MIVYQCQQPGFAPSPPSSMCVDNGTWSTDPTQVICTMIPTTATTATTGKVLVLTGKFMDVFQLIKGVTNHSGMLN